MSNFTRLRKYLFDKDLPSAVSVMSAPNFSWQTAYDQEGLLYLLFPTHHDDLKQYKATFSKKCLLAMIEHGYKPNKDNDVFNDFFTECHRKCFKDFSSVITKQDPTLWSDVFTGFLHLSSAFYHEHFEYLITKKLVHTEDGSIAFEQVWQHLLEDYDYIADDEMLSNEYVAVGERFLNEGFDIRSNSHISLVFRKLLDKCAKHPPEGKLASFLTDTLALAQKEDILQELKPKRHTGPMKKM